MKTSDLLEGIRKRAPLRLCEEKLGPLLADGMSALLRTALPSVQSLAKKTLGDSWKATVETKGYDYPTIQIEDKRLGETVSIQSDFDVLPKMGLNGFYFSKSSSKVQELLSKSYDLWTMDDKDVLDFAKEAFGEVDESYLR